MKRPLLALCLLLCPAGAHAGIVVYDNGAVNNLNTNILPNDVLVQDSKLPGSSPTTLNILTGGAVNNATVKGFSVLNINSGTLPRYVPAANVYAYGSSTVTADGYDPFGNLYLHDSSTATVGHLNPPFEFLQVSNFSTDGSSRLHVYYGEALTDTFAGNSTVVIDSTQLHHVGFPSSPALTTRDYANVTLHDIFGTNNYLTADFGGHSTVSLDNGYVWFMNVHDSARVSWSGSVAEYRSLTPSRTVSVSDAATLTIYGGNFNYAYGELPVDTGTLTGNLADGTAFHVKFSGGQHIYLVAAPAPSGVVLAVAGLVCLGGYWRRRMRAIA